jgi:hypothetical protein
MTELAGVVRTEPEQPSRRRSYLLIGFVALALLAVAGIGIWRESRAEAAPTLLGTGTAVGVDQYPLPLRRAAGIAGLTYPDSDTKNEVLLFHHSPLIHFSTNTSAAIARVAVCVRARGQGPILANLARQLDTLCSEVRYIKKGTRVHWEPCCHGILDPREYLIIVLTPTKPGVATVDRVTYDYERESGESGTDVGTVGYTIRAT